MRDLTGGRTEPISEQRHGGWDVGLPNEQKVATVAKNSNEELGERSRLGVKTDLATDCGFTRMGMSQASFCDGVKMSEP